MSESKAVQFMVATVAIVLIFADGLVREIFPELMNAIPLSRETCYLGGITLCSIILVLLVETKSGSESGVLKKDDLAKAPSIESQKRKWKYVDPAGKVHGPFATAEMLQWYKAGYLSQNLMLSFGDTNGFSPLCKLFPEAHNAFTVPPLPPQVQPMPSTEATDSEKDNKESPIPNEKDCSEGWNSENSDDEEVEIRKWLARRRAHYSNKPTVTESVVA